MPEITTVDYIPGVYRSHKGETVTLVGLGVCVQTGRTCYVVDQGDATKPFQLWSPPIFDGNITRNDGSVVRRFELIEAFTAPEAA